MKTLLGLGIALAGAGLCFHVAGCSEDKPTPLGQASGDAGAEGGAPITPLADPAVPCADNDDAIYADQGPQAAVADADRGAIMKCSKGADIPLETIQSELTRTGYTGKPITSGAHVFKVVYKTRRGDEAGSGGYSSAIVYVPTVPRANNLPIVVGGRGSRGQAARCAVTKLDPSVDVNDDALRLNYGLVGAGYAVIVPDLAGYAGYGAAGNPPSAYAQAADVGRSTLDGSRALKKLYPQLADKTVLVGHSQGGHSTLAALAMGESYGAQGPIVGVATYAPLWLSQRTWGALLSAGIAISKGYTIETLAGPSAISVWYHYSQAELLDGPGEGVKLFAPAKQSLIKQFFDTKCWDEYDDLKNGGATYIYEYFDPAFTKSVANVAAGLSVCKDGDAVCAKWNKRYVDDRPHLTGAAQTTPLLVMYGGKDTTITPDRFSCAYDRLKTDAANMTFCYEPEATHQTVIGARSQYVADWIGGIALGETPPAACADDPVAALGADTFKCASPPPND